MANIKYPTPVTGKLYAGVITQLRTSLNQVHSSLKLSPAARADVLATITAFVLANQEPPVEEG